MKKKTKREKKNGSKRVPTRKKKQQAIEVKYLSHLMTYMLH